MKHKMPLAAFYASFIILNLVGGDLDAQPGFLLVLSLPFLCRPRL